MENIKISKIKKFNKANLPFLIAIGIFILEIILLFIYFMFNILITLTFIFLLLASILIPLLCVTGLIFQILNKEKTLFDKIILSLNSIVIFFMIFLIVFVYIAFPNKFKGEKDVRKQIAQEYSTLNSEYAPVLDYLAQYKKSNGVYPSSIDEKVIPKSKTFEMYKYHTSNEGKGYWLQVYPVNGPIEYYYNDENDDGYNFYKDSGYIDSAFDNDYYYEINDKWHAVMLQNLTRHSILSGGGDVGNAEREADEWMKNNVEKFEKNK